MIIRTNMANRAAMAQKPVAPSLSDREKRRLDNTRHSEGRVSPVIPEEIVEAKPVEEVKVRVEEKVETIQEKEETAVVAEPIVELDDATVEPGTAMIRSKVLEELESKVEKPKKKYKVISIKEN